MTSEEVHAGERQLVLHGVREPLVVIDKLRFIALSVCYMKENSIL